MPIMALNIGVRILVALRRQGDSCWNGYLFCIGNLETLINYYVYIFT